MVTFSPYFLFREMEMASTSAKSELGQAAEQSGSIDKVVEVTGRGLSFQISAKEKVGMRRQQLYLRHESLQG